MEIATLERHFGIKLASGVSCGPGTLINVDSSGEGQLADSTSSKKAHGIALTSGAGTKTTGMNQYVRLDTQAKVANVDYVTLTQGGTVYLGIAGRYATSSGAGYAQKVGIALETDEAFITISPATFDN